MSAELTAFDELKAQVTMFVAPVKGITVKDVAGNAVATGTLKTIKDLMKQVELRRVGFVKPLNDKVKEVNSYAAEIVAPLEAAEREVKSAMANFARAELDRAAIQKKKIEDERRAAEQKARDDAARLAAEADAKHRAEQKALAEEQAVERKAHEEKQKKEAERAKIFGVDPEQQKREADTAKKALLEKEQAECAEFFRKTDAERLAVQAKVEREAKDRERDLREKERAIEAARPKNTRKVTKWELIDEQLVPAKYWSIDPTKIRAGIIDGDRDVPGLRIWTETEVVAR